MQRYSTEGLTPAVDRRSPAWGAVRPDRGGRVIPLVQRIATAALSLLAMGLVEVQAGPEPGIAKEYKVKATYLFNFAQYVEWPASAFPSAGAPITIGVLGSDEFGSFLDELVQGATVGGRPLHIIRSRQVDELKTCQVLFVSRSESARLAETLSALGDSGVLTVGESAGFAGRGGIIGFVLDGDKVRFEVNLGAAQRKGLKLSAQLLRLSRIVETDARQTEVAR